MSYCVHCGVELDASAARCALCGTPVLDPNAAQPQPQQPTPFAETPFVPKHMRRRFVAYLITVIMLIPNIVCSLANAIFYADGFWSFYINATSLLLWVVFVFPFFTKKLRPYLMWAFDTAAVAFYIFFFFVMRYESKAKWYYDSVLPIVLFLALEALVYMIWVRRKKRHWVLQAAAIDFDIGLAAVVIGSILQINRGFTKAFYIGMIVFISTLVLLAFLSYCYSSKHMRAWLSKKFYV
ncbi:MAG: zinc ribbon domain-containing protein [Clostridia bacterium]|nr:zinc ribbon domain-containing protein [Clostridia bacterium]MBQ6092256.1 zinc ribbon domain-containing protein [Clostridia bacterium]